MSAAYVRDTFKVPAKRGMRVTVDGRPGRITSFPGAYLGVRLDGERRRRTYHPTWRMTYHTEGTADGGNRA